MHPRLQESPDSPLNNVRIWTTQIESFLPAEVDELKAALDSTERARAARFHFEHDQKNYVATRGLLRLLLGATLNERGSKLVLGYGEHGKPFLTRNDQPSSAVHFNVSHSGGWAMFAVSRGGEIGLDLESAERLKRSQGNLDQLAARVLSPNELAIWQALPDTSTRTTAFLRAWTRKEAYAKATGRGLRDETMGVEVALDAAAPQSSLRLDTAGKSWLLRDIWAPAGFCAAVAVEQRSGSNLK